MRTFAATAAAALLSCTLQRRERRGTKVREGTPLVVCLMEPRKREGERESDACCSSYTLHRLARESVGTRTSLLLLFFFFFYGCRSVVHWHEATLLQC